MITLTHEEFDKSEKIKKIQVVFEMVSGTDHLGATGVFWVRRIGLNFVVKWLRWPHKVNI